MIKIDLQRGLIRAGDSLFDLDGEDLRAVQSRLTLSLLAEDYCAEIDLSEGVLHAGAAHDLPAGGYEVGEVSPPGITLTPFRASA